MRPTRVLSLNLGSQSVGLAEFPGQAAGGLVLSFVCPNVDQVALATSAGVAV